MELGVHLPQIDFDEPLSLARVLATVDAARECGFSAVSANDHLVFAQPWLDGPTALAAALERSGEMALVSSIALVTLRGPVPLAKTLAALSLLSGGRVVAGVGPGSSAADYTAVGVPFEERWARLDEAVAMLRTLLDGQVPAGARFYPLPPTALEPAAQVPLWIGSWGSPAGLRRVARLGDGWLASAYNTDPERFAAGLGTLGVELELAGRPAQDFPHALVTMWTWVTESRSEADRVVDDVLAPMLRRDPAELRGRVCVGPAERCAELLARYRAAGCRRIHVWPIGSEPQQVERLANDVIPRLTSSP